MCDIPRSKSIALAATALLSMCVGSFAAPDTKHLVVGMELEYPPFEFVGEDGEPDGVSVRMAEALAEHLGRPLRIDNIKFDALPVALKSGAIDLVISSMTDTEERRKSIDFSNPYVTTGLAMLVPKDSIIENLDDLRRPGTRIVVRLGTTGESFAASELEQAHITRLQQDAACALEISQDKADAWIYDQLSIFRYHKQFPKSTRALLSPIRAERWAIGLAKGNDALRADVNTFLAKFRAGGNFDRLGERYLTEEKKLMEQLGVPFIFAAATSVATVSDASTDQTEGDPLFILLVVSIVTLALYAFWRLTSTRSSAVPRANDAIGFAALWLVLAALGWFVFQQLSYDWHWAGIWARRWALVDGWLTSIRISLISLALCSLVAVALVAGARSSIRPLRFLCKSYTEIVRGSPLIVVLLVGYYVVADAFGIQSRELAGIVLLSLFAGAYLGEILRGGIESVGKTQFDSARAVGFDRYQAYRYVIIPQAIRRVMPAIAGLFIILIKDSSLLSYIGTEEFTKQADIARAATATGLEAYLPLALGYLALTIPLAYVARILERRFAYED